MAEAPDAGWAEFWHRTGRQPNDVRSGALKLTAYRTV